MRGERILTLLNAVKDTALESVDLLEAFLRAGYGASARRIEQIARQRTRERFKINSHRAERQRYLNLLFYLKRQQLLREEHKKGKKFFCITKKGKEKLLRLRDAHSTELPAKTYQAEASDTFLIVAFDIPESEKRKREWLREVLKILGFQLVQKSVWFGKAKIPASFLHDMRQLKLLEHVEIFEVKRTGSLERLAVRK